MKKSNVISFTEFKRAKKKALKTHTVLCASIFPEGYESENIKKQT